MHKEIQKVYKTDVLSVGGSGAGVMSAVYAARQGVNVLLVSQGKIGRSGNAIMAGGACGIDGQSGREILNIPTADESFTREKMFDCIVKESFYLSEQNMVRQYVEDAPYVMQDYLGWAEKAGCRFVDIAPCGWQFSGLEFMKPLSVALRETPQVEVLEDTIITDLLWQNHVITGAVGLRVLTGEIIQIEAKAVILATGGYQPLTLKNTVSDMTGDGQAMAYRAGARLSDMEFMLAFPTALVPEDMCGSIYPYLFRRIPHHLADKNGKEIVIEPEVQKLSTESKLNKLVNCYYMGHAVAAGLGGPHGGAYWDYSRSTEAKKRKGLEQFYNRFAIWHKKGFYKGESMKRVEDMILSNQPIEVGLGVEYTMGGIVVDENMRTDIEGLLAAGEVTAGTFGACRIGDGLIEMLAHGRKAGEVAAEHCKNHAHTPTDQEQADAFVQELLSCFDNSDGPNAIQFYNAMEKACDEGLGVIRTEEGLAGALGKIEAMKKQERNLTLENKGRSYNFEWLRAIQARNMLICDEASLRAALERRESRGCHIRQDYETVDHDRYLHHYDFKKEGDRMVMKRRKPTITTMPAPTGTKETIFDYFKDKSLNYDRRFKINFD